MCFPVARRCSRWCSLPVQGLGMGFLGIKKPHAVQHNTKPRTSTASVCIASAESSKDSTLPTPAVIVYILFPKVLGKPCHSLRNLTSWAPFPFLETCHGWSKTSCVNKLHITIYLVKSTPSSFALLSLAQTIYFIFRLLWMLLLNTYKHRHLHIHLKVETAACQASSSHATCAFAAFAWGKLRAHTTDRPARTLSTTSLSSLVAVLCHSQSRGFSFKWNLPCSSLYPLSHPITGHHCKLATFCN